MLINMKRIFNGLKFDLCEQINEFIDKKNIKAGDHLPSERELCKLFNVSRTTLREALSVLNSECIVKSYQGRGTIVAEKKNKIKLLNNQCFSSSIIYSGLPFKIENIEISLTKPDHYIVKHFELNSKTPVKCTTNLIYISNYPVALEKIYYLEKYNGVLTYHRDKLVINKNEDNELKQFFDNHFLFFERVIGKAAEKPVTITYSYIDSTKIKFVKEYYTL